MLGLRLWLGLNIARTFTASTDLNYLTSDSGELLTDDNGELLTW